MARFTIWGIPPDTDQPRVFRLYTAESEIPLYIAKAEAQGWRELRAIGPQPEVFLELESSETRTSGSSEKAP